MKLTKEEQIQLRGLLGTLPDSLEARQMRRFRQHGSSTTFNHVMGVVCMSFYLNRRLRLGADEKALVQGAFLHDFYLYDWHDDDAPKKRHGFRHPARALENARRLYPLSPVEANIIESHMWPLTLRKLPRSREAAIVCLTDKVCALLEFCRVQPGRKLALAV